MSEQETTADGRAGGRARQIAGAALPLYVTMVASSAGSLVDTVMLGRHATAALAAFAVTIAVFSPAVAAVTGAMRGVMPFVTTERDNADRLLHVVRNGSWLGIVVGLLGALAVAAVPLVGRLTGVPESTLAELGVLPALLAGSVLVTSVGSTATSALVGLGRAKAVMRAGMCGTAAAVVLSVVLVGGMGFVPALGLAGAGLAMLTSSLINAVIAHSVLRRSTILAGRPLRLGRPHPREVLGIAKVGIPLAATVLIKFAVLGVLALAAARISTESAAVHSIAVSLVNLMFTAAVAVGQATVPLVSVHVAAGRVREVRGAVVAGAWVGLCAVAVLGTALVALRSPVVTLFSKDQDVHAGVLALLPVVLSVVVLDAVQAVFGFGLVAIRRTTPSLLTFAVCYGGLALVAVPIASWAGLHALWASLACANLMLVLGQVFFFHQRTGKLRPVEPSPACA
ncbi:MATE family efflux transporter [Streptomyces sp. NPDC052496]|uniref:MATE family efflux transporter n=1 Tax=Streptomyces sp. NPDC052496 TaxID=3154951 RepID=UPI003447BC1F